MAAKKRKKQTKSPSVPPAVKRIVAVLTGPGRFVGSTLLPVVILLGACVFLWQEVKPDLLAGDDYQVGASDIEISPTPDWIRTDPREKAFGYLALRGPLSIMDDDATQRVAEAFQIHPWIERVIRVTKHHPARIHVDLKYRRPVCMVHCVMPGEEGLLPIDKQGVRLPIEDFNEIEANRYPLVDGIESMPLGLLPGMSWRDNRVVGAAQIAAAIGESWYKLKLHRIVAVGRVSSGRRKEYTFDLYTQGNRKIYWGCRPGVKIPGEPSAEEKLDRLRKYAALHGGLDTRPTGKPIDVRILGTPQAPLPMAATPASTEKR